MKKYLLIGKCRTIKDPKNAGGVIVLFEQLTKDLDGCEIDYKILDLNYRNYLNKFLAIVIIYTQLFFFIMKSNLIFFNGTAQEYKFYSWFVVLTSKIFGKKVILRKFAGNFHEFYEKKLNFFSKGLINFALKNANISYFETKYLVSYFDRIAKNAKWFPNIRVKPSISNSKNYSKRLIFLGHVNFEKGITEILKAKRDLGDEYTIDIYGPKNYNCPDFLKKEFELSYKGLLSSSEVIETLLKYDLLLLPTFHKGEGYPGVIIEALSVGVPIITTPLKGILEMIQNNESGIFVKPKNHKDLVKKIKTIDIENYKILSEGALKAFKNFDNKIVMKRIFREINDL